MSITHPHVKCATCGYLGVRQLDSRELRDAEEVTRQTGKIPLAPSGSTPSYDEYPLCFKRIADFRQELGTAPSNDARLDAFHKERPCHEHTAWKPGFTPKEHYEFLRFQQREAWEEARDSRHLQYSQLNLVLIPLAAFVGAAASGVVAPFITYFLSRW